MKDRERGSGVLFQVSIANRSRKIKDLLYFGELAPLRVKSSPGFDLMPCLKTTKV